MLPFGVDHETAGISFASDLAVHGSVEIGSIVITGFMPRSVASSR